MDLSTSYLGLQLRTPLIVGASPLADDTYTARQLQDAGAGAIVMRSLFEEQIYLDELAGSQRGDPAAAGAGRNQAAFPTLAEYQISPDQYLRQITDLKGTLTMPVIASLNGCRPGGWIDFARRFEAAGADAIELNLYHLSTDPGTSALDVESQLIETVRLVRSSVNIPVAVKLQPFFTALAHFVRELGLAGADGVVVFSRLFQSDFAVDEQEPVTQLRLSGQAELLLRLRWLALLSPGAECSLAITGGVQNGEDAIKAVLAGADGVQLVSALLRHGPRFLTTIIDGLQRWMSRHGYQKIADFRGKMNLHGSLDAAAIERGDYQRILQSWRI
jgi:dihydroorotate dehydrogenase (fumarate)